jgi:hypothetical protein
VVSQIACRHDKSQDPVSKELPPPSTAPPHKSIGFGPNTLQALNELTDAVNNLSKESGKRPSVEGSPPSDGTDGTRMTTEAADGLAVLSSNTGDSLTRDE